MRDLVRETRLSAANLVAPLFVTEGDGREAVASMPGVERLPVADAADQAAALALLGVRSVILFGIPATKDAAGSAASAADGVTQRAVRAIKAATPELVVITDVCMCEYTDHGHCGLVAPDGTPLNDETLPILGRIAVSHADAGADVVAPSGMMDGMVEAIRAALDAAGHERVAILSYSTPSSPASSSARVRGATFSQPVKAFSCMNSRRSSVVGDPSGARPFSARSSRTSVLDSGVMGCHRAASGPRRE